MCPVCGTNVVSTEATRTDAGTAVGAGANSGMRAAAGTTKTSVSSTTQTMKTTCPSCGTEIVGEHSFCPKCGVSLEENEGTEQQIIQERSSPAETYASASNYAVNSAKAYNTENSYTVNPAEQAHMDADRLRAECDCVTGRWCLKNTGLYNRSAFDIGSIFLGIIGIAFGKFISSRFVLFLGLVCILSPFFEAFFSGKNIFGLGTKFADKDALCKLGYRYYYGAGISQSHIKALEHFRLSADKGNVTAKYNLGYMYYYGHGVPQDYKMAAEYFRQAAQTASAT